MHSIALNPIAKTLLILLPKTKNIKKNTSNNLKIEKRKTYKLLNVLMTQLLCMKDRENVGLFHYKLGLYRVEKFHSSKTGNFYQVPHHLMHNIHS